MRRSDPDPLSRNQLTAANALLPQLQANSDLDSESYLRIQILEIDLRIREKNFTLAMKTLEKLADKVEHEDVDVWWRIKVMTVKARIYEAAGIPQKGFSVALRAASVAWSSKILPLLWEAVNAICGIFNSVKEYEASMKLLEGILPHVLECEDCNLAGRTFSLLADSHMGAAGEASSDTLQRKERLSRAIENIDRAFDQMSQREDIAGQCEMMAKKATIMHLNGDFVLANDCAAQYLAIKKAAKEE